MSLQCVLEAILKQQNVYPATTFTFLLLNALEDQANALLSLNPVFFFFFHYFYAVVACP